MEFLLDTNVVSNFFKRQPAVMVHFGRVTPAQLAISAVTVMEIEYGFERQPAARGRFSAVWAAFQADVTVLPYGSRDAVATAGVRAHLAAKGQPIGPFDLQLAGTALAHGLTLVTHNTGEFARVPGLKLQDWWQEGS
ncbi:PIN domain-containing protein [Deinococcus oregonensis]|uniref:Ribonuclease VapC n=1 Tax=Deinococcus oregonensis TaxID=1805970 RepID=A0ABV6B4M8_9DEIO